MIAQINNVFKGIEEKPLFYIESGSRLWGIASPDSDYDVRGFHLQSKNQYFDFKNHRDIIEIMNGDFDFITYDVDKMFGLLAKSNPTVFEWIRSNIIYFNHLPDWNDLHRDVVNHFDFKSLYHHYVSLAQGNINLMETNKKFTYKTAFYCIRGLLSADLATRQTIPELLIDDLFNQFEKENDILLIAKNSLERKKQKQEKEEVIESDKKLILKVLKQFTIELKKNIPSSSNNRINLEKILTVYSQNLKDNYYK